MAFALNLINAPKVSSGDKLRYGLAKFCNKIGLPTSVSQSLKEGMKPEALAKLDTIDKVNKQAKDLVQGLIREKKLAASDNTKSIKSLITPTNKNKPQGQSRG